MSAMVCSSLSNRSAGVCAARWPHCSSWQHARPRGLDVSSGKTGSAPADQVIDPLVLLVLGNAGELPRHAALKEVFLGKPPQPITATTLRPSAYGTGVVSALAWFGDRGITGLDATLADGGRVFVSVLRFDANVQTKPDDFRLE